MTFPLLVQIVTIAIQFAAVGFCFLVWTEKRTTQSALFTLGLAFIFFERLLHVSTAVQGNTPLTLAAATTIPIVTSVVFLAAALGWWRHSTAETEVFKGLSQQLGKKNDQLGKLGRSC